MSNNMNTTENAISLSTADTIDSLLAQIRGDNDILSLLCEKLIATVGINKIEDTLDKIGKKVDITEPLLNPLNKRFTAFPITYQSIWKLYKEQMACMWKAEEIDFSNDYNDFMTLNDGEKYFIEMILAFFAASDGIVNFNLSERFIKEVQVTEAIFGYQFQACMENIHCVAGNVKVLTDRGYKKIMNMVSENIKVWNGKEFSDTAIRYTGKSQLYRVELSNGMYLDCTPEHKWFIKSNNHCGKSIVFTKDLNIDDILYNYELPIMNMRDPNKKSDITKGKYFVPINYSKETQLRWLGEICDTDDCKVEKNIQITNNNQKFLKNIQLMLTTLGIHTTITFEDNNYIIIDDVKQLYDMGLRSKKHQLIFDEDIIQKPKIISITNIKLLDGIHETYCFSEPKEHAGIFNGILTSQSETYSLMLDNIVKDVERKEYLFNAITNVESVKLMADWAFKWIDSNISFAHRLVAFAVVEGVFFSGAFAAIFWIKKYKNKSREHGKGRLFMNGLVTSNKFISRDEGLHARMACELYSLLQHKLSPSEVNAIVQEGVLISQKFMTDAIPVQLIGMNHHAMNDYLEYIGDRLLVMLGYKKLYGKRNPFKFMETIGLSDKANFFEVRPHEYQDSHVMNKTKKSNVVISDDF